MPPRSPSTTATPHGLQTGEQVTISGVLGNTAANGTFTVTVTGPASFTLDGSTGSGTWISGGTVSQPALAFALNASVDDVLAIATALGATAPGLTAATRPGSLADMAMLAAIAAPSTSRPVRHQRRDAGPAGGGARHRRRRRPPPWAPSRRSTRRTPGSPRSSRSKTSCGKPAGTPWSPTCWDPARPPPSRAMLTTDDIYNYYLIDPEMSSCALMTRLLQASLAVQQFVQQCFLNLTIAGVTVDTSDPRWSEWSWRQQYRLWQAAREVFLLPGELRPAGAAHRRVAVLHRPRE